MNKAQVHCTRILKFLAIALLLLPLSLFIFSDKASAAAGINKTINFQGKVVNKTTGVNVANGTYPMTFVIYDKPSGGTALWTEIDSSVTVTDGIFRVPLGAATAFPAGMNWNQDGLFLDITFNSEQMGSRVQLTSVPYAMNAGQVAGLTVQDDSGNSSTSATLQLANGKTIKFSNGLTFAGTDSTTITFGGHSTTFTTSGTTSLTLPTSGTVTALGNTTTGSGSTLVLNSNPSFAGLTLSSGAITLGGVTGSGLCITGGATAAWGSCGGGSQTPWTSDIDADGWDLTGVDNLTANTSQFGVLAATAGVIGIPNDSYIIARNAANDANINLIKIDGSNLVAFGANTAAFTLGGAITGNSQNITGINALGSATLTTSSTASVSGTLTIGNGTTNQLRSAYGPLQLAYKSAANTWTNGLIVEDVTGDVLASNDVWMSTDNRWFGSKNASNRVGIGVVTNGSDVPLGAIFQAFGKSNAGTGITPPGGAEFIIDSSNNLTEFNIVEYNGGWGTLFTVDSDNLTQAGNLSLGLGTTGGTISTVDSGENLTLDPNGSGTIFFHGATYGITSTGALTVASCSGCGSGGGGSNWTLDTTNGVLRPNNSTVDFLIGGTSTASAKFVFGGLNAGIPTATFSGDLIIGQKSDTADADVQKWTKITGTAGTIGGGTSGVASVSAAVVYNGSLYVGTNNPNNAEIYRYDGENLGTWTKVSGTAGTVGGGATTGIDTVASLIVYNGALYAGTYEPDKAEIYRYDGSSTWTKVSGAAGTILTTASIDGVTAMSVFGGRLFAGTSESTKAELYMYNGGTTWIAVNGTAGTFVASNTVTQDAVTSIVVINNQLILGTKDATDADVVRWNGIVGGSNFFALNLASTTGSYLIDNAAQTGYLEVSAMTVWNGKLVIALRRGASLADILMYQEPPGGAAPINSWTRLNSAAGTITSGGTANIDGVTALTVYNGRLYAGTNEAGAAQIYRYDGDKSWTVVSQNTAGTLSSGGTTAIDSIPTLMPYNHNSLFAGTMETGKGEGYVYQSTIDQSYSLRFHAGTSQGGGEQNSLQNMGSISFVASLSANVNNKSGNTGAFVFTHSIVTNNGSYDVAEDYPTRDTEVEPGDLVSIDVNEKGFVNRSQGAYDYSVIGVYSENPGLRLSQDAGEINGGRSIPIALVGRVPIKVTTENGEIKQGDPLTPSSAPGVAMKAKKSGLIIAQALEPYSGDGVGKIMGYVKSSSYNGSIAQSFQGIEVGSSSFGQEILEQLARQPSTGNSETVTDRLIASIEIVSPKITVDELFAKRIIAGQIDGLDLITSRLAALEDSVATLSANLSSIPKESSESALLAKQNQLIDKISKDLASASASATVPSGSLAIGSLDSSGLTIFPAGIRVKGNGLFEGIVTVLDTITTNNFIVNGASTFFSDVFFKGKINFEKSPTYGSDTGGFATLVKGTDRVVVQFNSEFENNPIVNTSVSFDVKKDEEGKVISSTALEQEFFNQGYKYIIVNRSAKGFTIVLNKKAADDVSFTWTAIQVKDAKNTHSRLPE